MTEEKRQNGKIIQFFQQLSRKKKVAIGIALIGAIITAFIPLFLPSGINDQCEADDRYWVYQGIYHRQWCPLGYDIPWDEQGDVSNCNVSLFAPCNRCNPPSLFTPEPKIDYTVNFSGCGGILCNYGVMGSNYERHIDARLDIISDGILPNGLTFAHVHAIIDQNDAENITKFDTSQVYFRANDISIRASIFTHDLGEYDWNITLSSCSQIVYEVDLTLLGMGEPCTITRYYEGHCS